MKWTIEIPAAPSKRFSNPAKLELISHAGIVGSFITWSIDVTPGKGEVTFETDLRPIEPNVMDGSGFSLVLTFFNATKSRSRVVPATDLAKPATT